MGRPNLLTVHDFNAKYPVQPENRLDPYHAWNRMFRKWRTSDPQLLVENRHYLVHRDIWPFIFAYSEPKVIKLIFEHKENHPFCCLIYNTHGETLLAVIAAYAAPLDTSQPSVDNS